MAINLTDKRLADYEALLASTAVEMERIKKSPPMEIVAVKSQAGGFVMELLRVDDRERYIPLEKR